MLLEAIQLFLAHASSECIWEDVEEMEMPCLLLILLHVLLFMKKTL